MKLSALRVLDSVVPELSCALALCEELKIKISRSRPPPLKFLIQWMWAGNKASVLMNVAVDSSRGQPIPAQVVGPLSKLLTLCALVSLFPIGDNLSSPIGLL